MDWSTINQEELRKLPSYKLPPTYTLQKDPGSGCFLHPPGYPTYFTRDIYTKHGNEPPRGPTRLLNHRVVRHNGDWEKYGNWDDLYAAYEALMRKLWVRPPIESERVQAWITYVTGYFKNCYIDPRKPEGKRRNASEAKIGRWTSQEMLEVAPLLGIEVPEFLCYLDGIVEINKYLADHPDDNERYSAFVFDIYDKTDRATDYIRQWYPEYDGSQMGLGGYGKGGPGCWWETEAERPTPENCQPRNIGKHPVNGSRCQWCGWEKEE